LSKDDKILSLTLVDHMLIQSIIRMQIKINKKGSGKFSLVTHVNKIPIKVNLGVSNHGNGMD